jgi:hypothetical protein
MLYEIAATVETDEGTWKRLRQVPTFYLDSNVQGICGPADAESIATRILGGYDMPGVTVHVTATPFEEVI